MKAFIIIFIGAVALLFGGLGRKERSLSPAVWILLLFALIVNSLEYAGWRMNWEEVGEGMLSFSPGALVYSSILILLTLLGTMIYQPRETGRNADVYGLMLFSLCGAIVLTSFSSFFTLFLGVEILSIPLYVLAGYRKEQLGGNEAALKYFLMGSFATGILLFGTALIYGAAGSFSLEDIGLKYMLASSLTGLSPMAKTGIMMVMAGLLFKVSAAPFHFWAPDVYTGSPTRITAFMATVVKGAGIIAFFRLFTLCFGMADYFWGMPLAILAALTIAIGNLSALFQTSFKRMLAWSSVAHAGYLLMVVLNHAKPGGEALIVYVLGYGASSLIAFGIYRYVHMQTGKDETTSFNGLAKSHPFIAFCMLIALLSMAGIPATAGFTGKYLLFSSVFHDYTWLVVVALVFSALSIAYYFRVIMAMYFKETDENAVILSLPVSVRAGLLLSLLLIFALGLVPMFFTRLI